MGGPVLSGLMFGMAMMLWLMSSQLYSATVQGRMQQFMKYFSLAYSPC
jgi:hypothetical protein